MTDHVREIIAVAQPSLRLAAVAICRGISDPDELRAALSRVEALDLLEQWLDVSPSRSLYGLRKVAGKMHIRLATDNGGRVFESKTQEDVPSAIRTCIMIAQSEGEG